MRLNVRMNESKRTRTGLDISEIREEGEEGHIALSMRHVDEFGRSKRCTVALYHASKTLSKRDTNWTGIERVTDKMRGGGVYT